MVRTYILKNVTLYTSAKHETVNVLIENGLITAINFEISDKNLSVIDAEGRIIAPGLIDIHIQGAGGADVLDGTDDALYTISKTLARFGVTGFLATTVLSPSQNNNHIKMAASYCGKNLGGAQLLGLHLEGPFINPERRGGIASSSVFPPSRRIFDQVMNMTGDSLRIMTIAPEMEGNTQIIQTLVQNGIIASFGHSCANYEETKSGFDSGITHITHIFNAMKSLHHRDPGPILAIFEAEHTSVQIIADGVHIHPGIIALLYRIIGKDRCICITDGVQAIGLPEGHYFYHGHEYEARNGIASYPDGTLIGTAIALNEIINRFAKYTDCGLVTAVQTAAINPARLLGLDKSKGSIETGKDADLVILDRDGSVWKTFVGGAPVYEK